MKKDGSDFKRRSARRLARNSVRNAVNTSRRLDLRALFNRNELDALYRAAYYATLCNIAFNGLGGCQGQIKPEREQNRIELEQTFTAARNNLYQTTGWKKLSTHLKDAIHRVYLQVAVAEERLAR
jgi:hypothetical protein